MLRRREGLMSRHPESLDEVGSPARQERDLLAEVHLSTEEGIYGLILVAGLVAVAGASGLTPLRALAFILVTVIVFWVAHVFSGTVAEHSAHPGLSLRASFKMARKRSRGLLVSVVPPAVPLVLGATGLVGTLTADWIALWVIVAVLALLGYLTYARRGAPVHKRLLAAVCTAALGFVIIIAKALLHH